MNIKLKSYLLFLIIFISNVIYAKPSVSTSFNFYEIYPTSKYDLEREMNYRSTIQENGMTFKGYTKWHVRWNFTWKCNSAKDSCRIYEVTTVLNIIHTMPKIAERHTVSKETQHTFNKYYAALFRHEKGHALSGLNAAREIEQALLKLGTFRNSKILEETANKIAQKIIIKYNYCDIEYDKNTEHGKTQCVNFL